MTWKAVPSSPNRDQELLVASEGDGTDHIVGIRAARNQRRLTIEGSVPYSSRGLVLRLRRLKESASETCSQVFDIRGSQHDPVSGRANREHLASAAGSGDQPWPSCSQSSQ
jgi:hypothetical protein